MRSMRWNEREVAANVSLLFTELPYRQRFAAAAAAGFRSVESWWPFAEPHPGDAALDEVCGLVSDAGLSLTGLNFFAGDMPGGERGIACRPDRAGQLESGTEALLRMAEQTDCRRFNLLYGQIDRSMRAAPQHAAAVRAYRTAAAAVAGIGGTVLVEPLAGGLNGDYPLHTHLEVLRMLDEVGSDRVAVLVDTFHLGMNGVEPADAITGSAGRIGHVQVADVPNRGEPGSGNLDWVAVGAALDRVGYDGTVAAEYRPTGRTEDSLAWLDSSRDA